MRSYINYFWNVMEMGRIAFLGWNLLIGFIMYFFVTAAFKNIDTGVLVQEDYVNFSISYLIIDTSLRILPVRARVRNFNGFPTVWTFVALAYIGALYAFQYKQQEFEQFAHLVDWACLGLMGLWVSSLIYFLLRRGMQVV